MVGEIAAQNHHLAVPAGLRQSLTQLRFRRPAEVEIGKGGYADSA
jgi:hypothetical protein